MKSRKIRRVWGKPWDWFYLLNLERAKLREMSSYTKKHHRYLNWELSVRDMEICIKLIDIILEQDKPYKGWLHNNFRENFKEQTPFPVYVNTKNVSRFKLKGVIDKYKNSPIYPSILSDVRVTKALYLYNKIRNYKLFKWWT